MTAFQQAMRLIIDGVVVLPEVLTPDEIEMMRGGFERRAGEIGKRWMDFNDISEVPELMHWIAHPRLMAVIEPFVNHFGLTPATGCTSGIRDVYDPSKPEKTPDDPDNLAEGPYGWHDDVMGVRNPQFSVMETSVSALLYLDETFVDSGAYLTAVGSHHLAYADKNDKPVLTTFDVVKQACELRALAVKPGSVVIHRSHNWHGVMPTRQQRRLFIQTFTTIEQYDSQEGHTQFGPESLAVIPEDRHKYIHSYATPAGV